MIRIPVTKAVLLAGRENIHNISPFASFFLSPVDDKIDAKLQNGVADAAAAENLKAVKGKVAMLLEKAAQGASSSAKTPDESNVMDIDELIATDTANTLPLATIPVCADHCHIVETGVEQAYNPQISTLNRRRYGQVHAILPILDQFLRGKIKQLSLV